MNESLTVIDNMTALRERFPQYKITLNKSKKSYIQYINQINILINDSDQLSNGTELNTLSHMSPLSIRYTHKNKTIIHS